MLLKTCIVLCNPFRKTAKFRHTRHWITTSRLTTNRRLKSPILGLFNDESRKMRFPSCRQNQVLKTPSLICISPSMGSTGCFQQPAKAILLRSLAVCSVKNTRCMPHGFIKENQQLGKNRFDRTVKCAEYSTAKRRIFCGCRKRYGSLTGKTR